MSKLLAKIKRWIDRLLRKIEPQPGPTPVDPGGPVAPDPPPPVPDPPAPTPGTDEVPFASLKWTFGGFRGERAVLDVPRIGSLAFNGVRGLSYRWIGRTLDAWGLSHSQAGALACLFVQRADGSWIGGKFDWISTSRTTRDFKNIFAGYAGWDLIGVPNPCRAAFVIVSSDGRLRSNVIAADWSR